MISVRLIMDRFVTPMIERLVDVTDFDAAAGNISNWIGFSVVIAVLYVSFVQGVPILMKDRKPFQLQRINSLWNLGLTVFSFGCLYYLGGRLIEVVTAEEVSGLTPHVGNTIFEYKNKLTDFSSMSPVMQNNVFLKPDGTYGLRGGFETSVCVYRDDIYRRGIPGYVNLIFLYSKFFEIFDTVLLVLQKKRVIFLHWYHHASMLLYSVIAWSLPVPGVMWFSAINAFVHTLMYFYYFMCSVQLHHLVAPFASSITMLQIVQMIVGTFIAGYTFYEHNYGSGCDTNNNVLGVTLGIYIGYLVLFAKFFIDRYVLKKRPVSKGKREGRSGSKKSK